MKTFIFFFKVYIDDANIVKDFVSFRSESEKIAKAMFEEYMDSVYPIGSVDVITFDESLFDIVFSLCKENESDE